MRSYFWTFLFFSVLCACGGVGTQLESGGAMLDRTITSVARRPAPFHADRRNTWISPELKHKKGPLLFVSDAGTADVYIYSLPTLEVVGTVTGFTQPQGECADNKGDVWVTDTNAQTVYELSHHGQLENELTVVGGYPAACAWDATTGNLAVMTLFGTGSTSGVVLIYPPGSKSPTGYQNPHQYFYNFGGFDRAGDLFFDGRNADGTFMLSELPKGASSAQTIKLSGGTLYFPGMVEWDSAHGDLIVGDQSCGNVYASCLYSIAISGKNGTIKSHTNLQNSNGGQVCDLVQGTEYDNEIAGSDYNFCGSTASGTYLWPYPSGGAPIARNNTIDAAPVGAALSK